MSTTIRQCNCESKFQDLQYGKNNRIFNLKEDSKRAKCTVCGTMR